jgi:hypothetical protein
MNFGQEESTIPFKTEKLDEILGSWIKLPEKSQN